MKQAPHDISLWLQFQISKSANSLSALYFVEWRVIYVTFGLVSTRNASNPLFDCLPRGSGKFPPEVHMHVTRYASADLPTDDEELQQVSS